MVFNDKTNKCELFLKIFEITLLYIYIKKEKGTHFKGNRILYGFSKISIVNLILVLYRTHLKSLKI